MIHYELVEAMEGSIATRVKELGDELLQCKQDHVCLQAKTSTLKVGPLGLQRKSSIKPQLNFVAARIASSINSYEFFWRGSWT